MTKWLPSEMTNFQRALEFIGRELKNDPEKNVLALADEASLQFQLSPRETESLHEQLKDMKQDVKRPAPLAATKECEKCGEPVDPKCGCN